MTNQSEPFFRPEEVIGFFDPDAFQVPEKPATRAVNYCPWLIFLFYSYKSRDLTTSFRFKEITICVTTYGLRGRQVRLFLELIICDSITTTFSDSMN